ncbi:hypothetical protein ACGFMO_25895 [Streptomyces niveus]|uniref:hypothetical protein n=1 Tax=Streptomyces niveus TaxID=193462 RepID=UPI00370F9A46
MIRSVSAGGRSPFRALPTMMLSSSQPIGMIPPVSAAVRPERGSARGPRTPVVGDCQTAVKGGINELVAVCAEESERGARTRLISNNGPIVHLQCPLCTNMWSLDARPGVTHRDDTTSHA